MNIGSIYNKGITKVHLFFKGDVHNNKVSTV